MPASLNLSVNMENRASYPLTDDPLAPIAPDRSLVEQLLVLQQSNDQLKRELEQSRQAQVDLQRSQFIYRTLVENSSDCVCYIDLEGKIRYMNQDGIRLHGLEAGTPIYGQEYITRIKPNYRDRIQLALQRAQQGEATRLEYISISMDDQELYWDGIVNAIQDDRGTVIGLLCSSRNITQQKQTERILRQSEERFRSLLANIPGAVYHYRHGSEWRIEFISDAIADISGHPTPEFIQQPIHAITRLIHPIDRQQVEQVLQNCLTQQHPYALEYRILRADGLMRWIHDKGQPSLNRDGSKVLLDGILFDITDRKQSEQALRRSEATNRALLDAIPDLMIRMTGDGTYLDFITTKDFRTVKPAGDLRGRNIYDIMPPAIAQERMHYIQQALQTGTSQSYEFDLCLDGITTHEEARIAVSGDDEVVVIVRDITDRKQAEEELRQTKDMLEERVRERTAKLQEQTHVLKQALQKLQQTQSQLIQTEKMSSLGQLVSGVAHEINNPVNFIHGNVIHASRYAEDLLRLLSLYQQHNPDPIPTIQAEIEAIDLEFLVEDLPKLLTSMRTGTERIRQIVLSLRNFSRLDEAEVKPVDIHAGIDSTLMILQHRLKARSDRPAIQILKDYGNLPLVDCYAGELNQVFMNLLANAIDALESDYAAMADKESFLGAIAIRTTQIDAEMIRICIADNGSGVPEAVKQRIFDPFFTTKPVGQGTGLGLSISHQIIVRRHQGKFWCVSEPGQGSEFWIEIPIQQT
jgi:PAS domain S-box-containing protein